MDIDLAALRDVWTWAKTEEMFTGTQPANLSHTIDPSVVKGKTAFVTGGANGIGRGIAVALAEAGALVIVGDKDEAKLQDLTKTCDEKGLNIKTVTVDVTSWPSQVAAFQQILTWSNNLLDIVVPAAGILLGRILDFMPQDTQDLSETPPEPPVSVFDVNLKGVYYTADLALFYFRKIHAKQPQQQQSASFRPQLLFLASLAAYGEMAFRPDYDAAKMGVRMMWKTLRRNTAWCGGMQTNLLAPTFINTDMLHADVELLRQRGVKVGEVRDVVDAALRCICDPSIDARAICVCATPLGEAPGSKNFDLCDDHVAFDGGRELMEKLADGRFGVFFKE